MVMILDKQHNSIERRIDALARAAGADRCLPVWHRPNVITPKRELFPSGASIMQIVDALDLPAEFKAHGVVTIDRRDGEGSQEVPRARWRYVKPRADSLIPIEVNLWLPPCGNDARQIISLVAAVAIIAAASFIAGPAGASFFAGLGFGGFSGLAAGAASLAVAIGGTLAIRALTPPPSIPALDAGSAGALDKQLTPASLSGNVLRPGSPIPLVLGTRKIFPPIVVKPLVETVGDDEYATAVFALSGSHQLNNIRADGVPLDDIDEVEYETREGFTTDTALTLITRQSKTDASAIELSEHDLTDATGGGPPGLTDGIVVLFDQTTPANSVPQWHRMVARGSPDEIWISLNFLQGLFDSDSVSTNLIVPIRGRLRAVGDTSWINLPEVFFTYRKQQQFRKDLRIKWATAPSMPEPPAVNGPYLAYSAALMDWTDAVYTVIGDFNTGAAANANDGTFTGGNWHKSGSTASAYTGVNFGATHKRKAGTMLAMPYNPDGFTNAASVTLNYRVSNSVPANAADGTLVATTGSIADTTSMQTLVSSDQTTDYQYQWLEMVGSTNANYQLAELALFDAGGDWSWLAHSHFYTGLTTRYMNASNYGSTQIRNMALYDDRADFFLDAGTHPQGDYEIEIRRGAVESKSAWTDATYDGMTDIFNWQFVGGDYVVSYDHAGVYSKIVRDRLSLIWNEDPIAGGIGKLALIAVKAKNRQINALSVEASKYVSDWNGTAFATINTSANPASHIKAMLTGRLNADPLPDNLVDLDSLADFWDRCDTEGFTVNAVIEGTTIATALQLAAGCGYGRVRQSETFGVIMDYDRSAEAPVQIFTSRNSRGYRYEKPMGRLPSGLRAIYADASNDYLETELLVDDPDGDGAARYEEIRYDAFVTEADVEARALFDLAQARARMASHGWESNGQAIKCQRNDLVAINHPVLDRRFGAGYVLEVLTSGSDVTGLVLDAVLPNRRWIKRTGWLGTGFILCSRRVAEIRLPDETYITAEIDVDAGSDASTVITFIDPITGPVAGLDVGTMVYFGSVDEQRLRLIVTEIQPKAGASFPHSIVAVDEAPELWAA